MTTDFTTKTCTKCSQTFPATTEYFYKKKNFTDGLEARCKQCKAVYARELRQNGVKPKPERKPDYKTCTKCLQEFPSTTEYFHHSKISPDGFKPWCKVCTAARNRQRYIQNRERIMEVNRRWREANPEKQAEASRNWQKAHPERVIENSRQWYIANRERDNKRAKQYQTANRERIAAKLRQRRRDNPDKARVYKQRRKARERSLPDTLTHDQWQRALQYFNGCCAVCGCQLRDLFGVVVPHADHWIPLASPECPGTTATNMLPLCNSCNQTKNDIMPRKWLERKYGKRKAKQILGRIEKYFEWAGSQV